MIESAYHFACSIKANVLHAVGDQGSYWTMRLTYSVASSVMGINLHFGDIESFLFYHGWLILLIWRCLNAALDTYKKRIRDVRKPEWETQVNPILESDAKRESKLSTWQKIKNLFKSTL